MSQPNRSQNDPLAVKKIMQAVWLVLVIGCVFTAVAMAVASQLQQQTIPPGDPRLLTLIGAVLTMIGIPAAFFTRGQAFKRGWVGDVVLPRYYALGVILSCAICDGLYMVTLMLAFVMRFPLVMCITPAIAFVGLLLLWPNGRAMFPLQHPDDANPYRYKK